MSSPKSDIVIPVLADTLVPTPAQEEEEEKEKPTVEEDNDAESDYESDDTVTILRPEYV